MKSTGSGTSRTKVGRFLQNLFHSNHSREQKGIVSGAGTLSDLKRRTSLGSAIVQQKSSLTIDNRAKSTLNSPREEQENFYTVDEPTKQVEHVNNQESVSNHVHVEAPVIELLVTMEDKPLERKRSKSEMIISSSKKQIEKVGSISPRRFSEQDANTKKGPNEPTFDELEKPIHEAASKGDLATIKKLAEESPSLLSAVTSKEQNTPLHIASMRNNIEVVKYLLEKRVDVNALNKSMCTPLHLACAKGHMSIVEELVTNGNADVTIRDGNGNGSFQLCVKFNRFDLADCLVALTGTTIDVNAKTEGSKTLLHICAELGNLDAVKYLVERYGSKLNYNIRDNHGRHLLFSALKGKNVDIIRFIATNVPEVKFNVIMQERGRNLLHQAVEDNSMPMVRVLHEVRPHVFEIMVNERDKVKGHTPLHTAVVSNRTEIVALLIEWGADTNIQDSDGNTPLHLALNQYKSKEELAMNSSLAVETSGFYKYSDIITKLLEIPTTSLDIKNAQKITARAVLKKKNPGLLKNLKTLRKIARGTLSAR
jgi:ankyrin repeat protein